MSLLVCNTLVIVTSCYRYFRHIEDIKRGEAPRQPSPAGTSGLVLESHHEAAYTGDETSITDSTSQNQDIHHVGPLDSVVDLPASTNSYHIELTELFESDFVHSTSPCQ